jgi:hypothetical protein
VLASLSLLTAGCYGATGSAAYRSAGEKAASSGDHARAAANFAAAATETTGDERAELDAARNREFALWLKSDAATARGTCVDGRDMRGYDDLVRVRIAASKLEPKSLQEDVGRDLLACVAVLWPRVVEPLVEQKKYAAAARVGEKLLSYVSPEDLTARLSSIRRLGADVHRARFLDADGRPGGQAMHQRLARRFGLVIEWPGADEVRALTELAWTGECSGGSACEVVRPRVPAGYKAAQRRAVLLATCTDSRQNETRVVETTRWQEEVYELVPQTTYKTVCTNSSSLGMTSCAGNSGTGVATCTQEVKTQQSCASVPETSMVSVPHTVEKIVQNQKVTGTLRASCTLRVESQGESGTETVAIDKSESASAPVDAKAPRVLAYLQEKFASDMTAAMNGLASRVRARLARDHLAKAAAEPDAGAKENQLALAAFVSGAPGPLMDGIGRELGYEKDELAELLGGSGGSGALRSSTGDSVKEYVLPAKDATVADTERKVHSLRRERGKDITSEWELGALAAANASGAAGGIAGIAGFSGMLPLADSQLAGDGSGAFLHSAFAGHLGMDSDQNLCGDIELSVLFGWRLAGIGLAPRVAGGADAFGTFSQNGHLPAAWYASAGAQLSYLPDGPWELAVTGAREFRSDDGVDVATTLGATLRFRLPKTTLALGGRFVTFDTGRLLGGTLGYSF